MQPEFRDDRHATTQARFGEHVKRTRTNLHDIADKLKSGEITNETWAEQFDKTLAKAHGKAHALGRNLAGDPAIHDIADSVAGRTIADLESGYLQGFLTDLHNKDPRYFSEDGELDADAVKDRMDLYLGRLRGTGNEAFVETSEPTESWDWIDSGGPNECEDCSYLASGSPYSIDTLPTHPGANDTPCLSNCRCHLTRASDGKSGFLPLDL